MAAGHARRRAHTHDDDVRRLPKSRLGRRLDAELGLDGEQPLSEPEFVALRAYTGPLFEKYNAILRAPIAAFFRGVLESLGCADNKYETTLQVLSAAIVKLSKLTQVSTVYRAPGRALAPSFWRNARDGLAGIIETGCLSTSADREVAMQYARRSNAKLLFELKLGFVARGADIGKFGLSQYPSEGEILLPPLTALQMVDSRVEKDLVIVTFRPTIASAAVKTGADDNAKAAAAAAEAQKARDTAAAAKEAAHAEAQAAMQWKLTMSEMRVKQLQRQATDLKREAASAKAKAVADQLKAFSTPTDGGGRAEAKAAVTAEVAEHVRALEAQLAQAQKESEAAQKEATARRAEAERAAELEAMANKQLQTTLFANNARLARVKQQEIIASEKAAAAMLQVPDGAGGGDGADGGAAAVGELEAIMQNVTDLRKRKVFAEGDNWEGTLSDWFATAARLMREDPQSMSLQNLGCCTIACLVGEINEDMEPVLEGGKRRRRGGVCRRDQACAHRAAQGRAEFGKGRAAQIEPPKQTLQAPPPPPPPAGSSRRQRRRPTARVRPSAARTSSTSSRASISTPCAISSPRRRC